MIECIITGCCLIIPEESKAAWGDLHLVDDNTYIFNATLNKWETHWEDPEFFVGRRALILNHGASYFERRAVIVVSAKEASLNEQAKAYLKRIEEMIS